MGNNIFTGTIPALMTPCTAERTPDYDALRLQRPRTRRSGHERGGVLRIDG